VHGGPPTQPCEPTGGTKPCQCLPGLGEVCEKCPDLCSDADNPGDALCGGTSCCCRVSGNDILMCPPNICSTINHCGELNPSVRGKCCRTKHSSVFGNGVCGGPDDCWKLWKPRCTPTGACELKLEPHVHVYSWLNSAGCNYQQVNCMDHASCLWHYLPPAGTGGCNPWPGDWRELKDCPPVNQSCDVYFTSCLCEEPD
jgi:hypothetical protein